MEDLLSMKNGLRYQLYNWTKEWGKVMKTFNYLRPTEISFCCKRISELREMASKYGKRCLIVTVPIFDDVEGIIERKKNEYW